MRLQDGKCCLTQFFCVRNHSEPAISVLQAIAHALLSFCSAGLGVSIFPETFITYSQYDFSHHCFYTIEDYDSKNIIVLNYRNTRYLSKTIQAFVNTVREVVDAQTGLGANR